MAEEPNEACLCVDFVPIISGFVHFVLRPTKEPISAKAEIAQLHLEEAGKEY